MKNFRLYFFLALLLAFIAGLALCAPRAGAAAPELELRVILPSEVTPGQQFTPFVAITNPTGKTVSFEATVWTGGKGVSGRSFYVSTPNTTVFSNCLSDGCAVLWTGTIPAGESATLLIPTVAGAKTGTFPFMSAGWKVNGKNQKYVSYDLTIR